MAKRIEDFVKRRGPLSERQVDLVREWLAEDWESKDIDSNAVALISRLVDTIWEIDCIKKGRFARTPACGRRAAGARTLAQSASNAETGSTRKNFFG